LKENEKQSQTPSNADKYLRNRLILQLWSNKLLRLMHRQVQSRSAL